jgi:DNA-binding transcriptional MocR family regulator
MKRLRLAAERLHELLDYDPDTGVFTWLEKRGRVKAGDVAGTLTDDGVYIRVEGRRYSASPRTHILIGGAAAACGFATVIWNKISERRTRPTQDDPPSRPAN